MKMHSNMNKTYKVTRNKNSKYIKMYRNGMKQSSTINAQMNQMNATSNIDVNEYFQGRYLSLSPPGNSPGKFLRMKTDLFTPGLHKE